MTNSIRSCYMGEEAAGWHTKQGMQVSGKLGTKVIMLSH